MAKNTEDAAEELAESTHNESEAARPIVDAGQLEAFVARPDEDLMASSIMVKAIVLGVGASSVAPLPCILGGDSSESKGNAVGAGSASATTSEETASVKVGRSVKAQHLEESEAESNERPSLVLPQGLEATPTSPLAREIGAPGFIDKTLHLGNLP
jgi:hypothetical protein